VETALELYRRRVQTSGPSVAFRFKRQGSWRSVTWDETDRSVRELALGLLEHGIAAGDRVAILANTRYEWVLAELAILSVGAVSVPIYQSNTPAECAYILTHCGARAVFAEDPQQVAKLLEPAIRSQLTTVAKVFCFDETCHGAPQPRGAERATLRLSELLTSDDLRSWASTLAALSELGRARAAQTERLAELERRAHALRWDDAFTIVYTSGTTGPPKGAVLTQANIVSACDKMEAGLSISSADEQLLFLPVAHIFARTLAWATMGLGLRTTFAESIAALLPNLVEVRPTFMGGVPRVFEKVYSGALANAAEGGKVKKAIFDWAVAVGRQVSRRRQAGANLGLPLRAAYLVATKLVFSKLHAKLGGRMRILVSGGAPLAQHVAEFLHAAGLTILEGYGLTETTAATHVNRPHAHRLGTVGLAMDGVETRIAEDGEVLIRAGNVMKGYFNDPEATRAAIDDDGWLHTGDVGVIESGGFLRITDRKKDLIITAGGKNVAPQNLEGALKSHPLVSQVVVCGDRRPYLVALVTLNEDNARKWALQRGLVPEGVSGDELAVRLASTDVVKQEIQSAFDGLNRTLASYEAIKKFAILPRDLTQEAGELTPSLKVKRKVIIEKYAAVLGALYGE
jgi:long-chain acyl-CoA synthetase